MNRHAHTIAARIATLPQPSRCRLPAYRVDGLARGDHDALEILR